MELRLLLLHPHPHPHLKILLKKWYFHTNLLALPPLQTPNPQNPTIPLSHHRQPNSPATEKKLQGESLDNNNPTDPDAAHNPTHKNKDKNKDKNKNKNKNKTKLSNTRYLIPLSVRVPVDVNIAVSIALFPVLSLFSTSFLCITIPSISYLSLSLSLRHPFSKIPHQNY